MLDLHLVQPFTTFEQPNDLSLLKRQKRRPRPHRDGNNGRRRRSHLRRSLVHSRAEILFIVAVLRTVEAAFVVAHDAN